MQEILLKQDTLKEDYQSLEKINFIFFRTQSLLMDKVIKSKKVLELVISHSSGYKTSSENFFLLVIYYLTKFDDVI